MLRVTNNGDFDLNDRYNGIDYAFPKGESVLVIDEVAKHIFGFGAGDKTRSLVRLGWLKHSGEMQTAMEKLGRFSFSFVDELDAGVSQSTEQGLAPLQIGSGDEAPTDGGVESSVPIPQPRRKGRRGRAVLEQLSGSAGG